MEKTTFFNSAKKPKFNFLNKKSRVTSESGTTSKLKFSESFKKKLGAGGGVALLVAGVVAVLVFLFIVKPAYAVLDAVKDLKRDSDELQNSLVVRDVVRFKEALDQTERDLDNLGVARDRNFGWTRSFPLTKEYYSDSNHFIAAGKHGVEAGREFAVLIEPFASAVGLNGDGVALPSGHSGLAEAFASWISVMPEVAQNMDGVIAEMSELGKELKQVDASKYPEYFFGTPIRLSIEGLQRSLANVDQFGPDIKTALELIPPLLGVGAITEQRYAIIMQNDKEIRATGGFWTNYATFKINNAMLTSDFTSKDMYSVDYILDPIDPYHTFPKVPAMYEKYLKVERMFARDANISPDFPTSIDQWMYFYDLGATVNPIELKPINGVVAIDTEVVRELLAVTGPVTVNGVTFDENNVVLELEKIASLSLAEQANRKKVLGDLMEGMLQNVFESDNNLWPKLIDKAADLVRRKHILAVIFDEQAQTLLDKYNISGRIVDPVAGDYVYPVQTNLGGDKTNLFVTKEVTHTLTKEGNRWVREVDLAYTYTPKGGEYGALESRFQDWMRLYVPAGSEFISLEGSQEPNTGGEERGKQYFDGFTVLAPNETSHMKFRYYLPDGLITGDTYSLYIEKQPGINTEVHNVIVNGKKQTFTIDTDKTVTVRL